jgi:hypothetical protein
MSHYGNCFLAPPVILKKSADVKDTSPMLFRLTMELILVLEDNKTLLD